MSRLSCTIRHLYQCMFMLVTLLVDAACFLRLSLRSPVALAAENLFLRKQLGLYQEHHVKPRQASHATRITLLWLSRWFDWHRALVVVQPETFTRWRRQGLQLFRPWTSCPGRPPIPAELQGLIRQMASENLTWGQRRIANELRLKLGLQVSPRTVRKYMSTRFDRAPGQRVPVQRWHPFLRNHAWDLIVRGVAADLPRGRRACFAHIIPIVQGWWNRAGASQWQGTPPPDTTWLSWQNAPASGLAVWLPIIVKVTRVDQRSPPDGRPSGSHDPGLATQAIAVDRFDVCPAGAVRCRWHRANPHTRSAKPLSQGGSQVVPWRRAA
jgi:Homeodomain-like domain